MLKLNILANETDYDLHSRNVNHDPTLSFTYKKSPNIISLHNNKTFIKRNDVNKNKVNECDLSLSTSSDKIKVKDS